MKEEKKRLHMIKIQLHKNKSESKLKNTKVIKKMETIIKKK